MLWWLHFHSYVWYAVIIIIMAWNLQFRLMIVKVHAYSMAHSPNNPWPTLLIYLPSCGHYANSRGRRIVEQGVIYILTTVGSDSMGSWGGAILRSLRRKCSFFWRKEAKKKNALLPTKDIRRLGPISAGYISIHWMTQLISLLFIRVQLFKRWIVLSTGWITLQRMAYFISVILIHWIVIYPVDSVSNVLTTRASWIVIYPVDSAILSVWTTGTGCREDIIASYRLRNHCGKFLPAGNQQRISELWTRVKAWRFCSDVQ